MDDTLRKLVVWGMLGKIARKIEVLSEIDDHAQNILNPQYPKPSRPKIKADAQKNFKRTMHLLQKGKR